MRCIPIGLLLALIIICPLSGCATAQQKREKQREASLMRHFGEAQGCFILLDLAHGQTIRCNAPRCAQRFSPCSAFKIPNSLIGLDTGVIEDADFIIPWDRTVRDREELNRNHSLRSAFQDSVVWYYQELARRVGLPRMQTYIDAIPYGNCDLSGGLTTFWLGSTLQISADEQAAFLQRLTKNQLPFSKRSMEIVRGIMLAEDRDGTRLYGKTGSSRGADRAQPPGHDLGWYVGWVQRGGGTYIFATNMEGDGTFGPQAREATLAILKELGIYAD